MGEAIFSENEKFFRRRNGVRDTTMCGAARNKKGGARESAARIPTVD